MGGKLANTVAARGIRFPILTPRLALRPFTDQDLAALHAMHGREDVTRYLDWEPFTLDKTRALLRRIMPMTRFDATHDELRVAAVLRSSGQLIADLALWRPGPARSEAEIGFIVHPDVHGQGYGTEGMRELMRIGFEEGGLERIFGTCDARNIASRRLMERLGLRVESDLKQNSFIKGERVDDLILAISAEEWRRAYPNPA